MAVVEVVGILIVALSASSAATQDGDVNATARQFEGFFALLADRFLDVNAFVRGKAISVSLKICECVGCTPHKTRAHTPAASPQSSLASD
jgi:hypothetical protein